MANPTKDSNLKQLEQGILRGDRVALGRGITLVESDRQGDRIKADRLVETLLPKTGKSIRVGITGSPGVGKSTFIEVFGRHLTSINKRVAVLAVDPTSKKTKGSILGDKTRMDELSRDTNAYIRPSPTGNVLGGVGHATRQTILLCEAAGFDIILIETVGVGQSEVAVRDMVDFFLLLMLAGAGDDLQGIKKGIMEMADGVAITKADGENIKRARKAQSDFKQALHWFQTPESGWIPQVLLTSSIEKTGISEIWKLISSYHLQASENGFLRRLRDRQQVEWFYQSLDALIKTAIESRSKESVAAFESKVKSSQISPAAAARQLVKKLGLDK